MLNTSSTLLPTLLDAAVSVRLSSTLVGNEDSGSRRAADPAALADIQATFICVMLDQT